MLVPDGPAHPYRLTVPIFQKRKRAEHQFRLIGSLLPPTGFDTLTSISVGPSGPVALWSTAANQEELLGRYEGPGGATFAETRAPSQPRVSLASHPATSLHPDSVTVVDGHRTEREKQVP